MRKILAGVVIVGLALSLEACPKPAYNEADNAAVNEPMTDMNATDMNATDMNAADAANSAADAANSAADAANAAANNAQ